MKARLIVGGKVVNEMEDDLPGNILDKLDKAFSMTAELECEICGDHGGLSVAYQSDARPCALSGIRVGMVEDGREGDFVGIHVCIACAERLRNLIPISVEQGDSSKGEGIHVLVEKDGTQYLLEFIRGLRVEGGYADHMDFYDQVVKEGNTSLCFMAWRP